jgi:hypothetical protein
MGHMMEKEDVRMILKPVLRKNVKILNGLKSLCSMSKRVI